MYITGVYWNCTFIKSYSVDYAITKKNVKYFWLTKSITTLCRQVHVIWINLNPKTYRLLVVLTSENVFIQHLLKHNPVSTLRLLSSHTVLLDFDCM